MCNRSPRRPLAATYAVLLAPTLLFAVIAPACSSHYKVTDTASGRTYYTTDIDHPHRDSAIRFKDARTKAEVTLPSSEVQKISKKEYKDAVKP